MPIAGVSSKLLRKVPLATSLVSFPELRKPRCQRRVSKLSVRVSPGAIGASSA
jgi:hypothetical protein